MAIPIPKNIINTNNGEKLYKIDKVSTSSSAFRLFKVNDIVTTNINDTTPEDIVLIQYILEEKYLFISWKKRFLNSPLFSRVFLTYLLLDTVDID